MVTIRFLCGRAVLATGVLSCRRCFLRLVRGVVLAASTISVCAIAFRRVRSGVLFLVGTLRVPGVPAAVVASCGVSTAVAGSTSFAGVGGGSASVRLLTLCR